MTFLIVVLTIVMVLNCLLLALLVLVQLPKKEAGAGLAFGAGATDALFGAGKGNVLTQITKYSAGLFFFLALVLSVLSTHANRNSGSELRRELAKPGALLPVAQPRPAAQPATTNAEQPTTAPLMIGTNTAINATTTTKLTNAVTTNPPAK
jgi:preprotein translocase subunit SecG